MCMTTCTWTIEDRYRGAVLFGHEKICIGSHPRFAQRIADGGRTTLQCAGQRDENQKCGDAVGRREVIFVLVAWGGDFARQSSH